ncbi:hypothetical protein [Bacillus thuringiensis]|uniref:hypothetical protein n=1 Tax=Bacillus thuringiensis TaxID=1428 RepID=UPI001596A42E|nr:hypothetical protein [Bacillus thuringiensis]
MDVCSIIEVGFVCAVVAALRIVRVRHYSSFIVFILIEFKALSLPLATAIVGGFFFAYI